MASPYHASIKDFETPSPLGSMVIRQLKMGNEGSLLKECYVGIHKAKNINAPTPPFPNFISLVK